MLGFWKDYWSMTAADELKFQELCFEFSFSLSSVLGSANDSVTLFTTEGPNLQILYVENFEA